MWSLTTFIWICLGCLALSATTTTTSAQTLLRGPQNNQEQNEQDNHEQHRHLLQVEALHTAFQLEKSKYYGKLAVDYGEYSQPLFHTDHNTNPIVPGNETVSLGRAAFIASYPNANVSWARMVRKMTLKIIDASAAPTGTTSFVWATGGHSAAAGHGNLFNESYTNVMNVNAKGMFAAVGLEFSARSYAMGGTTSAVEIASCSKEVFGMDADVISWDYGMCDGREYARGEFYARRAALIPTHPAVVYLQTNSDGGRLAVPQQLTAQGYTSLGMLDKILDFQGRFYPDSGPLTPEQVAALPKYARNVRCSVTPEKCANAKWTNTGDEQCEKRRFRTSWHPGWQWHTYRSHVITLFLMEIIEDALELLRTPVAVGDPAAFAQKLREEEQQDYQAFMASSDYKYDAAKPGWVQHDFSQDEMYKSPNYCHTARLPAETRAKGILTGRYDLVAQGEYDKGIEMSTAHKLTTVKEMPLVYEAGTRQVCQFQLQNDFKDLFLVSSAQTDYVSVTLPTDSEVRAYGGPHQLKGVIAVCSAACGWKCPPDTLDIMTGVDTGALKFRVNGLETTHVTKFDACAILQLPDGRGHVFPPQANGRFEIAARVTVPGKIVRISSIMVW